MTGRAIAETLDVAIGTVHSRLHAARAELALALGAEET
jgi:DNA-directed RNA polymerase specialized sigma24 family protein